MSDPIEDTRACPASTPPPASPRCWAVRSTGAGASRRAMGRARSSGAIATTRSCSRPGSRRAPARSRSWTACCSGTVPRWSSGRSSASGGRWPCAWSWWSAWTTARWCRGCADRPGGSGRWPGPTRSCSPPTCRSMVKRSAPSPTSPSRPARLRASEW